MIDPANTTKNRRYQQDEEELVERTEVLYGTENILNFILPRYANIKESIDACFDYDGPSHVTTTEPIWQELLKLQKRKIKIRFLTDIREENVVYCKKFLSLKNSEIRHMDSVKGNFGIADRKECFEHAVNKGGELPTHAIFTTVKGLVDSRLFLFENLWKKGIPAVERMKEIEEGVQPSFVETIRDPLEMEEIAFNLIKSARQEIQIIFSTSNSPFTEEGSVTSITDSLLNLLTEKMKENDDLQIRILLPCVNDNINPNVVISTNAPKLGDNKIAIQYLDHILQTPFSIVIVDGKYLLVIEYKESNIDICKSIGMSTYSNSEAMVLSYSSIFEKLWVKSELMQPLQR